MSDVETTIKIEREVANPNIPGFDAKGLKEIKVIVGLGNPGSKYANSRHNIGFMVLDKIASRAALEWLQNGAIWAHLSADMNSLSEKSLTLCKPNAFMNNSGNIASSLRKNGITPNQVLVIHDELERVFGYVGIRHGGSARGHNGLRSIMEQFGKDFWRMGIGIGRPDDRQDVGNYVLSSFTPEEKEQLSDIIDKAIRVLLP
ncbi:aminoacyl-tRNA hydrolase [Candidatus Babeliales bacterium]|nr:aminoacyl-tRNA hydrolase [Candidatus Babeliales bacterium]